MPDNMLLMSQEKLSEWLETASGRQLVGLEQQHLRAVLPGLVGFRLLQVGRWGFGAGCYENSQMLQHWVVDGAAHPEVHARFDGRTLPMASRSIDVAVLPHSLELVRFPHRLLREVDRVLCLHGHVVIHGFNPLGLWAARQRIPVGKVRFPSGARFYSSNRMRDWLELLDFEVVDERRYGMAYPWTGEERGIAASLGRAVSGPLCQAYQMLARKRVVPVTPIRQRWRRPAVVTPAALPEARVHRIR
jgi:hypothetical protein